MRLLDPGPLPHPLAASTDISKLVRADYGADAFLSSLGAEAIAGWQRWNRETQRPLYHEDGVLMLSREPLRPGTFEGDSFASLQDMGWPVRPFSTQDLREAYPSWRLGDRAEGYLGDRGGWAESGSVMARLIQQCREAGVRLLEGVDATSIVLNGGKVLGVESTAGPQHADWVVLATGAWTPQLAPWLQDRLWVTGHPVVHLKPKNPSAWRAPNFPPWAADISRTGFYGFPATADGLVKVAIHSSGTPTDPGGPRLLPPGTHHRFRSFLSASLPGLADAPIVEDRLCLYCETFDGDFWIDRDPQRKGLVVAAGGAGHGFKFAPVLGDLVADAVEGMPGPRAHRFRWRRGGPARSEPARAQEPQP